MVSAGRDAHAFDQRADSGRKEISLQLKSARERGGGGGGRGRARRRPEGLPPWVSGDAGAQGGTKRLGEEASRLERGPQRRERGEHKEPHSVPPSAAPRRWPSHTDAPVILPAENIAAPGAPAMLVPVPWTFAAAKVGAEATVPVWHCDPNCLCLPCAEAGPSPGGRTSRHRALRLTHVVGTCRGQHQGVCIWGGQVHRRKCREQDHG